MERDAINIPGLISLTFPCVEIPYTLQFQHSVIMGLVKLIRNMQEGTCSKEQNGGTWDVQFTATSQFS